MLVLLEANTRAELIVRPDVLGTGAVASGVKRLILATVIVFEPFVVRGISIEVG